MSRQSSTLSYQRRYIYSATSTMFIASAPVHAVLSNKEQCSASAPVRGGLRSKTSQAKTLPPLPPGVKNPVASKPRWRQDLGGVKTSVATKRTVKTSSPSTSRQNCCGVKTPVSSIPRCHQNHGAIKTTVASNPR